MAARMERRQPMTSLLAWHVRTHLVMPAPRRVRMPSRDD